MLVITKPHSQSANEAALEPFLGIPFRNKDAFLLARQQLEGRLYPRKQLVDILHAYNSLIGNDDTLVKNNINALLDDHLPCVVTGQQLGLMGGPAYTILKGISCLRVARTTQSVPIFWLATEDHDVSEIDHTYLIDPLGNLERFHLLFPRGVSVEDLTLTSSHRKELSRFFDTIGVPEEERVHVSDSYSETMARALAKLFAGTGMVFLEPRFLRKLAIPFFRKEIKGHVSIQEVLLGTTRRLESEGGVTPLKFNEGDTHLFFKSEAGVRQRLQWNEGHFNAGKTKYTLEECLQLCDSFPERFSPDVAARPILQSYLLPVLAYVAGPSEMAYYRQLGDYHRYHGVPMPCVIPRMHATLITPTAAKVLEQSGLEPWETLPHHWQEIMPSLVSEMETVQEGWLRIAARSFGSDLEEQVLSRVVKQGGRRLMRHVIKARLRRQGLPSYGLHLIRNLISPQGKPQERVLNWWGFQAESSVNLIEEFLGLPEGSFEAHYYCYLD